MTRKKRCSVLEIKNENSRNTNHDRPLSFSDSVRVTAESETETVIDPAAYSVNPSASRQALRPTQSQCQSPGPAAYSVSPSASRQALRPTQSVPVPVTRPCGLLSQSQCQSPGPAAYSLPVPVARPSGLLSPSASRQALQPTVLSPTASRQALRPTQSVPACASRQALRPTQSVPACARRQAREQGVQAIHTS